MIHFESYADHASLAGQLHQYWRHFSGPHLDMVLASISAGNTPGELWVFPQSDATPLLLLWDRGNEVFYLSGNLHNQASFRDLAAAITSDLEPRAVAAGVSRVKVRVVSPSLEEHLPTLFLGTDLRESRTLFLVHDRARDVPVASTAVHGLSIIPITPAILASDGPANGEYVLDEIRSMWPSEAWFYYHGFGSVAILDGEIVCWCTTEYVSPTRCGIGIATAPRYEGRGIATATASHFVQEARERGVTPYWECDVTNRGSVRVAEKVGFVPEAEEIYWIGSFMR